MSKHAFIFGNGGHAHVVASLIENRYKTVMFVTLTGDGQDVSEKVFFEELETHRISDIFVGIGDNENRRKIFEKLAGFNITPAICVAPNAFVAKNAHLGAGAVICSGAVIATGAHVGQNTIVNTLSSVDHDCSLGNHSQLTAGVILGGNTTIGENCFFGIRSATIPGISVGDNTTVMAGSLVTQSVSGNVMLGGYPARVMKEL